MNFFNWFRRPEPRKGLHFGKEAAEWAGTRFPGHLQPVAACLAELLCEQLGVGLSSIEPTSTFIEDLQMDDLEPVEVVMALEEEFGVTIPDEDCEQLETVAVLVEYLYQRLPPDLRET